MAFSISAAITFRRVKSGLLKTVRKMRSVSRCWISISATASFEILGLIDWRRLPEIRLSAKRLSAMRRHPAGNNHKDSSGNQETRKGLSRPEYPFVAILGQEEMKLALLLNAIDPLIGGVLIMGHRGTGKSTAVRGLTNLLPQIKVVADCSFQCDPKDEQSFCTVCDVRWRSGDTLPSRNQQVQVIELPLGATEDRVCGSINLGRALKEGATVLEPGLLARANRGFLYIDEVNLLDDHLVDLLLDVAASGVNRIEREGVSVEHPSRFVLIGSGNPEEGELRPQLLDRFGLHVEITTEADMERRVGIVELRDSYDRAPLEFSVRFADEQKQLANRIVRARRNINKTRIDRSLLTKAARLCVDLGIEGHRGELTLVRAARSLAAFEGRTKVIEDDLRRVAAMALRHRLPRNAFEDSGATDRIQEALDSAGSNSKGAARTGKQPEIRPVDNGKQTAASRPKAARENEGSTAAEFPAPPAKSATKIDLKSNAMKRGRPIIERESPGKRRRAISEKSGRHVRSVRVATATRRIALAATVRALIVNALAADRSPLTSHDASSIHSREPNLFTDALRYKLFSRKHGALFVFVIDTSGSMARQRIGLAKRAILDLLKQSYLNRDSVAIVTFRGTGASIDLPPSRSIARARRAIDSLIVGGSTPLSAGLLRASEMLQSVAAKQSQKWIIVFTDGRANVALRSMPIGGEEREAIAQEIRQLGLSLSKNGANVVVADTQRHFERNEDTKHLARLLDAQLINVLGVSDMV
jgi:magnesium chelatase subunit D